MAEDGLVVVALLAHHGRPDLTQSHAVAPACAREVERLRNPILALLRISGIAVIIAWYVLLSAMVAKKPAPQNH